MSKGKRVKRYVFSAAVVLFMVCLVLALVFGVIVYRVVLMIVLYRSEKTRVYSGIITSVTAATLNLIIIIILGRFYAWLAVKLTDMGKTKNNNEFDLYKFKLKKMQL